MPKKSIQDSLGIIIIKKTANLQTQISGFLIETKT